MDSIENRLVEIVFEYSVQELKTFLEKMGMETHLTQYQELIVFNPCLNKRCGFHWQSSDYSTRGAMLGFILAGEWWTQLFPDLMNKIKVKWTKK